MRNDDAALDRMIEEALSYYASAEPLAGIEQRVMNRVRTARGRRRGVWRWMLAGTVAAVASVVLVTVIAPGPIPDPPRVIQAIHAPEPQVAAVRPLKRIPMPRKFPTPRPVTREERALLALASGAPDEAREIFEDLRKQGSQPIQFEEIKIEPIEIDGSR